MKLSVFCLLLLFCVAHGQFQVPGPDSNTSGDSLGPLLANLQLQLDAQIQAMEGKVGTVYIRWGKTTCENEFFTQTVYSGVAGGSWFDQPGGGTNYQCLPTDPQWGRYQDGVQGSNAYMYGAQYDFNTDVPFGHNSLYEHNVPCAVCDVPTRSRVLMIPSRNTCPTGWIKEYDGYLMAGGYNHPSATEYVCVDGQPETAPGGQYNHDGALFYPVEARCGSLPCGPYVEGRELTCVVCTK